jgi:3-isopropylmalate/(R)-2-methylmalate dehydratase small subunit
MTEPIRIERVQGRAVVVRGDDIDTDRIIPARFLKAVTFEGLDAHLFEDDRKEAAGRGHVHPMDEPGHRGARVLVVGANFGCGSSREHAPQAIARWGIKAIVGESFAEIFFGNALMIGLPCVTIDRADLDRLMALADAEPAIEWTIDLGASRLTAGDRSVSVTLPAAARSALRSGNWDATALLLDRYEEVERTAAGLPYLTDWAPRSS